MYLSPSLVENRYFLISYDNAIKIFSFNGLEHRNDDNDIFTGTSNHLIDVSNYLLVQYMFLHYEPIPRRNNQSMDHDSTRQ